MNLQPHQRVSFKWLSPKDFKIKYEKATNCKCKLISLLFFQVSFVDLGCFYETLIAQVLAGIGAISPEDITDKKDPDEPIDRVKIVFE